MATRSVWAIICDSCSSVFTDDDYEDADECQEAAQLAGWDCDEELGLDMCYYCINEKAE